jgi:hypothetical protein
VLLEGDFMSGFKLTFLLILFLLIPAITSAQPQLLQGKEGIYAVIKDTKGDRVEGYLLLDPPEIAVSTKDNQEKSVPLKLIESIKLEKIQGGIPGADRLGGESYYSVRVQNSQEIFTLKKKYTISLNTSVGLVTKTIDPEMVQDSSRKDSSPSDQSRSKQPFVRDKNVILTLEIKF